MARYTMAVKTMCETVIGLNEPSGSYNDVIKQAAPILFNFDFPFWNEEKRAEFEQDFLRHFYMREIGAETINQWRLYLEDHLKTYLPYYNNLWEALAKKYDWMLTEQYVNERSLGRDEAGATKESEDQTANINTDATSRTTGSGNATTDTSTSTTTDNTSENVQSHTSTPQGKLDNFLDGSYLDDAQKDDGNDHTETDGNTKSTTDTTNTSETDGNTVSRETRDKSRSLDESRKTSENETLKHYGFVGKSPAELLKLYLNAQRQITAEFYESCEPLFMLIY